MRVVVVGGGIGGLCLAQGLRGTGVEVSVHERDSGAAGRWEGYRLHINPAGARALRACLPAPAWREFLATAGAGGDFGFLDEGLRELVVVEESIMYPGRSDAAADHYAADRATLRRVLGTGLDAVVRRGDAFVGYDPRPDGRVEARFASGDRVVADLLVGADGSGSRVRRQLLPEVDLVDTGAVGIAHKVPLTDGLRAALPRLTTGMNLVNAPAPCFLFTSAFEPPPGTGAPYLLCALVVRADALPPDAVELGPDALLAVVDVLVADWHPELRRALAGADPASRSAVRFRATGPLPPWRPGPVTVLGDAIHTMPPIGGLGGNTALRDAHLLSRLLTAVDRGERGLLDAVGAYEAEVRDYGPAAVRTALRQLEQGLATGRGEVLGARAWFRLCSGNPWLRRRTFGRTWTGPAAPRDWERAAG